MIRIDTSGPVSGRENMDADVRSARECMNGRAYPHLRLYGWSPAAVSLGAHQDYSLFDRSVTIRHGVDIVVRPTGGGAILHTDELTYCITLPLSSMTPSLAYDAITAALLTGLRSLGIQADADVWPTSFSPSGGYRTDPLCFSGIARNEIRVGGKKLVGSAQRIYRAPGGMRVLLQHGSVLLSDAHTLLPVYMRERDPGSCAADIAGLRERSTSVDEILGDRPKREDLIDAFRTGFESTPMDQDAEAAQLHERQQEVIA